MTRMTPIAMDKQPDHPVREEELHALLDGQLSVAERTALERRLEGDLRARATLQAWQAQRDALRLLHAPVLSEPTPPSLLAAAQRAQNARHNTRQTLHWGGMAAGLLLAFGLGWFTHAQLPGVRDTRLAGRQAPPEFIHQAALAHAVYVPEVRHAVEVDATQEEHLVQWLSKRLGRPLKTPRLADQGFELVGGRLLPGAEGARAQFMYQNGRGERVTLYLGSTPMNLPVNRPTGPAANARGTEFRYAQEGPVSSFYWVDEGNAYALSGTLSRPALLQLAQRVYEQL